MGPMQIVLYLGGALFYALPAGAVVLGLGALAGWRPTPGRILLVLSALFVVFLGLHPFPSPENVVCKGVILRPFAFLDGFARLWHLKASPAVWMRNLGIISPIMNVVFFAGVGMALASQTRRWRVAAGFGACLSGFIELSQATGLWGVYPCPYRTFEVDDLILNITGVLLGFAVAHAWFRRSSQPL